MTELVISGGGETSVAAAALLQTVMELRILARELAEWLARLARERRRDPPPTVSEEEADPDGHVARAEQALTSAHRDADALADALQHAAEAYGVLERGVTSLAEIAGAATAQLTGQAARVLALLFFGSPASLAAGGAAAGLVALVTGGDPGEWLMRHKEILSDPRFVRAIAIAVSSVDNGMLGMLGAPFALGRLADDRASGLVGVRGAARALVATAEESGLGLGEAPVTVREDEERRRRARPPGGFHDLASRIPDSSDGRPQLRIEKYVTGGQERWIVYIGGTAEWTLRAGSEPFDLTSNVQGVAGLDPGSLRTVEDALAAAGAKPGDELLAVGYSQGGLIAALLAARGGYRMTGVVTFGAPTAGLRVPKGVPEVAVRHAEDIVPALGGLPRSPQDGGLDATVVTRPHVLTGGREESSELLPAHSIVRYRDTAAAMDSVTDARLRRLRATLGRDFGGGEGEASFWRGERTG